MLRNVRVSVCPVKDQDALAVFVAGEAPDGRPAHLRLDANGRLIRHRHPEGGRMEPLYVISNSVLASTEQVDGSAS